MSATLWQQISPFVLDGAVAQTFQMLVDSDASLTTPIVNGSDDDVAMAVYCEGEQQRALIVRCSHALALSLTSRMLEIEAEQLATADVHDAIGEVVNVIAGGLRGVMEDPGAMSTPFSVSHAELGVLTCFDHRTYLVERQPLTLYRI